MITGINDPSVWGFITGIAMILVGILVLWAYGARRDKSVALSMTLVGPEAEATRLFHGKLVRWFLFYGCVVTGSGLALLIVNAVDLM